MMNGYRIGVSRDWQVTDRCAKHPCQTRPPDFCIKRHDTKPKFRVKIDDCDGPLDLRDENLVLEANIWFSTKLRDDIRANDTYFRFVDNQAFQQVLVDDIIVMNRPRLPEHMLITGIDEENSLVQVQRGYHGTTPCPWKKGTEVLVFRQMSAPASIESVVDDVTDISGEVKRDQLIETFLVYEFTTVCTCLPGCYMLEFKLLKMEEENSNDVAQLTDIVPSFTYTPSHFHCTKGQGVEWVRRFPVTGTFLFYVEDSPTAEIL